MKWLNKGERDSQNLNKGEKDSQNMLKSEGGILIIIIIFFRILATNLDEKE